LYLPAFCGALLLAATARADAPAWWTDRNVIVTNAAGANDFAPVNAGQVKWIAVKAYDELEQHLPGGAGPDLATVISGFSSTNNYCPVNVGQLKNLAKPFYDRLIAEDHTDSYPWTATTSDDSDYAIANIGQVKQLFGFDLTKDTDQDGLPDWYEATISTNDVLPDGDADRDLLLNLEEYQAGTDPLNFDTDGDLLSDAAELRWYAGVDPLDADSDGDGVLDGKDLCGGTVGDPRTQIHATYVFSPFNLKLLGVEQGETYEYYFARGVDEDGDFLFFLGGTATADDDSGELICEDTFVGHGKAQGPIGYHDVGLAEDPDGDGLSSGFEIYVLGTYPDKYDSDGDGTSDGLADSDRDGLKNVEEYNRPGSEDYDPLKTSCPVSMDSDDDGTNDPDDAFPLDPAGKLDTDGDGMPDELLAVDFDHSNPALVEDLDDDGDILPDAWETQYGLDPKTASPYGQDTDEDGYTDLDEYFAGSSPTDSESEPTSVAAVTADIPSGFQTSPLTVTLDSENADVHVYYTVDGSEPIPHSVATPVSQPTIQIESTTVLRATAWQEGAGMAPAPVITRTYVFAADVVSQSGVPEGYPAKWGDQEWEAAADYDMDNVIGDEYGATVVENSLKSIPTLSIAGDLAHLFGEDGLYDKNTDDGYERPVSIEWIYPDGRAGSQVDCSLKPHGWFVESVTGGGADLVNLKRSFQLSFKEEFGAKKWKFPVFEGAPLHSESGVGGFDRLILRAGAQQSYSGAGHGRHEMTAYTRDQWARDTQIALSGDGVHGTFVHLYLNGLYWGVYNACEKPDHRFMAAHEGGADDDWYVRNHGGELSEAASSTVWDELVAACADPDTHGYSYFTQRLDVGQFCDYVLTWWYAGGRDWQELPGGNNFYLANNASLSSPIKYFCWDLEQSWLHQRFVSDGAWVNPSFLGDPGPTVQDEFYVAGVLGALWKFEEFRLLFADRIYKHCFNGGALTDEASMDRWLKLCDFVRDAMIAESARWGDSKAPYGTSEASIDRITRDDHWYAARDYVFGQMDRNAHRLVIECRLNTIDGYPLYPMIDPPEFSLNGNELELSAAHGGEIWYTLNGQDPKDAGTVYGQALTLVGETTVKARLRDQEGVWSALAEETFLVETPPPSTPGVYISEIMYHPQGEPADESSSYEFIEIHNGGDTDVTILQPGWTITGVSNYELAPGTVIPAGGYMVFARDTQAFSARYPGVTADGQYSGKLSDDGEEVELLDHGGAVVDSVEYGNRFPWPRHADGGGYSLVRIDGAAAGNDSANWRSSRDQYGSPGESDPTEPLPYPIAATLNAPPAVSAGPEKAGVIAVGGTSVDVLLEGYAVDDGAPALTYAWTVEEAPEGSTPVTFDDDSLATPVATFEDAGDYTLKLTVSDGELSGHATTVVRVRTDPAAAGAGFWLKSGENIVADANGLRWTDSSLNAIVADSGTLDCSPAIVENAYRGYTGLRFDKSNDRLVVPAHAEIHDGVHGRKVLTVVLRTGSNVEDRQVVYEQGGGAGGMNVYIENGQLCAGVWDDAATMQHWFSTPAAAQSQYAVELVYEEGIPDENGPQGRVEAYVNGRCIGMCRETLGTMSASTDLGALGGVEGTTRIGSDVCTGPSCFFGGTIFDVSLFNAITDTGGYCARFSPSAFLCSMSPGSGSGGSAVLTAGCGAIGLVGVTTIPLGGVVPTPPYEHGLVLGASYKPAFWMRNTSKETAADGAPVLVGFVQLNDDHDGLSTTEDRDYDGTIGREGEVMPITLAIPKGHVMDHVVFECNCGGRIRVWKDTTAGKRGWLRAPYVETDGLKFWEYTKGDIENNVDGTWSVGSDDHGQSFHYKLLHVEGIALSDCLGDASFTWTAWNDCSGDELSETFYVSVMKIDLLINSTLDDTDDYVPKEVTQEVADELGVRAGASGAVLRIDPATGLDVFSEEETGDRGNRIPVFLDVRGPPGLSCMVRLSNSGPGKVAFTDSTSDASYPAEGLKMWTGDRTALWIHGIDESTSKNGTRILADSAKTGVLGCEDVTVIWIPKTDVTLHALGASARVLNNEMLTDPSWKWGPYTRATGVMCGSDWIKVHSELEWKISPDDYFGSDLEWNIRRECTGKWWKPSNALPDYPLFDVPTGTIDGSGDKWIDHVHWHGGRMDVIQQTSDPTKGGKRLYSFANRGLLLLAATPPEGQREAIWMMKAREWVEVKIGSKWYVVSPWIDWRQVLQAKFTPGVGWDVDGTKDNYLQKGTFSDFAEDWEKP